VKVGRYSLLGPDFHRLDRTSLRLAHSFDDLVGAGEKCWWDIDTERLGSSKVNCELKFCWLNDWHIGWLFSLEDATDIQPDKRYPSDRFAP